MKACVFPGQGAQFVGMGRKLFGGYPEITAAADAILEYSVEELCVKDPENRINDTRYTQPALYVVNALTYMSGRADGATAPDFVAGHSLGEYNALLAAGVFSFEEGLRLVQRRGELMSEASGGRMAAVLGCDSETVLETLERHELSIDVANYNSPVQVVLSGSAEEIDRAAPIFSKMGATYRILNVSAAFHSRFMEPFVEAMGEALDAAELRPPEIPVIANVTARPYGTGAVAEMLRRQIREPVRWTDSVQYLLRSGVDEFDEVGPGRVLTKLITVIRKRSDAPSTDAGWRGPSSSPVRREGTGAITAEGLGAGSFLRDHGVRRAYVAGSMYAGISSVELVVRMARAGYLAIFGTNGLELSEAEAGIRSIARSLHGGEPFGVNLHASPDSPESERERVELYLKHGVRCIEASGFVGVTPALVRFRLAGLSEDGAGRIVAANKVIAKVSRPEGADAFLDPPPERLVAELVQDGLISEGQARMAARIPMADDLCVEADSGWLTERGASSILLPTILRQRDAALHRHDYPGAVRVGAAGGIGTPEAAAAAFVVGADFILTGSINQCTVESGASEVVKDLLQAINVQDTDYAPAPELFELGGKTQVMKKGVRFPGRATRLHDLWRTHGSWQAIEPSVRERIEREYFGRSFEEVGDALERTVPPEELSRAHEDPRHRMALAFRWYLDHALRLALAGVKEQRRNFHVPCGPALGAFNQWVKGTALESWRHRHVEALADEIMEGAAELLDGRWRAGSGGTRR